MSEEKGFVEATVREIRRRAWWIGFCSCTHDFQIRDILGGTTQFISTHRARYPAQRQAVR